jgi:alpha-galactosidase
LGYELDLKHLLDVEKKEIKAQIAFYKEHRILFQYGAFRRTETGWQVSDGETVVAGVFHRHVAAAPGYERLRVPGLDAQKRYRVTCLPKKLRVGQFGDLVKHVSPVSINPHGAILRLADAHYAMDDGAEVLTASGGALGSGILLQPAFRGTGYDTNQRNQGDYGSDLYIIQTETP